MPPETEARVPTPASAPAPDEAASPDSVPQATEAGGDRGEPGLCADGAETSADAPDPEAARPRAQRSRTRLAPTRRPEATGSAHADQTDSDGPAPRSAAATVVAVAHPHAADLAPARSARGTVLARSASVPSRAGLLARLADSRTALAAVGAVSLAAVAVWTLRPVAEPPADISETAVEVTAADSEGGARGSQEAARLDLDAGLAQAAQVGPPTAGPTPEPQPEASAPESVGAAPLPPARPAPARPTPARTAPIRPEPARPEPARTAEPEPAAQTGTARILVRPFGDVYVDGRRLASGTNAPVTADLAPGSYTVRATHPTFGEIRETVRVQAGRTAEVRLQFAVPVEVTVVSDPLNAEILLDGRRTGRYTPATIAVPPGRHTVGAERDGYRPASQPITVTAGQDPARVLLALTPDP